MLRQTSNPSLGSNSLAAHTAKNVDDILVLHKVETMSGILAMSKWSTRHGTGAGALEYVLRVIRRVFIGNYLVTS